MKRILISIGLGIVGFSALPHGAVTAAPTAQAIKLSMLDFSFKPNKLTFKVGTPIELTVRNDGKLEHEFAVYPGLKTIPGKWDEHIIPNNFFQGMGEVLTVIDGNEIAATNVFEWVLKPGKAVTLEFTPNKAGVLEIGCHADGHYEKKMFGTITVTK